jgi:hypothetical protein
MNKATLELINGLDLKRDKINHIQLPMGSGKTELIKDYIRANPDKRILVIVPSRTTRDEFKDIIESGSNVELKYIDHVINYIFQNLIRDREYTWNEWYFDEHSLHKIDYTEFISLFGSFCLEYVKDYDVVFLDETDLFNTQAYEDKLKEEYINWYTSHTLHKDVRPRYQTALEIFLRMIASSKTLVLSFDANPIEVPYDLYAYLERENQLYLLKYREDVVLTHILPLESSVLDLIKRAIHAVYKV